ncbi:MAG TPA: LysM domain-containing protein, partial [Tissierellaceae bacterium]|nr:LysM domain-containing protein [Tissierellaceae bacterium]
TLRASEKVDWTGWKDLKVQLPDNKALYPLKVKNIYIKLPKNSQFEATLIFDNLHLYDDYFTYKVKAGDTIFDISLKFYGTSKYMNEILRLNNMNITDILPVGKLLKLRVP